MGNTATRVIRRARWLVDRPCADGSLMNTGHGDKQLNLSRWNSSGEVSVVSIISKLTGGPHFLIVYPVLIEGYFGVNIMFRWVKT